MRIKRAPRMCCICHAAPVFQWNRCVPCARVIDLALKRRLQAMTAGERRVEYAKMAQGEPPAKFEWLGDEEALARIVEEQERATQGEHYD